MLVHLRIRDFAIIDLLDLTFESGFTVVTGETGAGKSILVGALVLALGGRASASSVRAGAGCAEVEALFDLSDQHEIRARLERRELTGDDPSSLLVRRVVGPRSKGKVVLNGRLATVATLAEIMRGLVDISGQHEHLSLVAAENHLEILDAAGALEGQRAQFSAAYEGLKRLLGEREALRHNEQELLAREDYVRFQLEELDRLAPEPGEVEALETDREKLCHADKLKRGTQTAEALLYGGDGSACDRLGGAMAELQALCGVDASLAPPLAELASARRMIEEAAHDLQRYASRIEADPVRLDTIVARLAELKRLCRKHGGDLAELLGRRAQLAEELATLEARETRLGELEATIATAENQLAELTAQLRQARVKAAKRFSSAVEKELGDMELGGARFEIRLGMRRPSAEAVSVAGVGVGPNGGDEVEFLWSANQGEPPKALAKIASGGELSRLMLAVKRVLCKRDLVSLYVFDEVDAGLGGKAADAIGRKIQAVAAGHQAITITHLAPIAARADHHLRVRKATVGGRTTSMIEPVTDKARCEEVARMIDGGHTSPATREAARAMLERVQAQRASLG